MSDEKMKKYSAEWIEREVRNAGAGALDHHDCTICGVMVSFIFSPKGIEPEVSFRSACGCSWSPDRPSSWQYVADWLAIQRSDEIRDRIWRGLQVPVPANP